MVLVMIMKFPAPTTKEKQGREYVVEAHLTELIYAIIKAMVDLRHILWCKDSEAFMRIYIYMEGFSMHQVFLLNVDHEMILMQLQISCSASKLLIILPSFLESLLKNA